MLYNVALHCCKQYTEDPDVDDRVRTERRQKMQPSVEYLLWARNQLETEYKPKDVGEATLLRQAELTRQEITSRRIAARTSVDTGISVVDDEAVSVELADVEQAELLGYTMNWWRSK